MDIRSKAGGRFPTRYAPRRPLERRCTNSYKVRYAFVVGTALAVMPSAQDSFLISTS